MPAHVRSIGIAVQRDYSERLHIKAPVVAVLRFEPALPVRFTWPVRTGTPFKTRRGLVAHVRDALAQLGA
ncbi:hypothetical protein B0O95_1199 [Mycetohabitans endofungorum]|uniref:Uncharacterized protein n=1 Tax=Mycetohabitans endofungorum TaxID=417203 RepID=A0A2P5K718_9BURK|nr:hypothetical protein B0O95_1199 [Mycetohabitans endofungorum]